MAKINKKTIRVIGLQRSGNHAIIRWIISQFSGENIVYLNNVDHGNLNPIETCDKLELNGVRVSHEEYLASELDNNILLYSYEDAKEKMQQDDFIKSVFCENFEDNKSRFIGDSHESITIVILRDPFNFFASRLKKLHSLTGEKDINLIKNNWKQLAKIFTDSALPIQTNDKLICVNYNNWFVSKAYRQSLSKTLGGSFTDSTLSEVSGEGGGSSFDGVNFSRFTPSLLWEKRAKFFHFQTYRNLPTIFRKLFNKGGQEMKVLERWKAMQDDPDFKLILEDNELRNIKKQIF